MEGSGRVVRWRLWRGSGRRELTAASFLGDEVGGGTAALEGRPASRPGDCLGICSELRT